MKITIISTLDHGGAANASKRLLLGLELIGLKPFFLTKLLFENFYKEKISTNPFKRIKYYFQERNTIKHRYNVLKGAKNLPDYFSFSKTHLPVNLHPEVISADIINLHWCSDFISSPGFFEKTSHIPMVITLHDMNYFTGGCHYSFDCQKFVKNHCELCWQLEGSNLPNASNQSFDLKQKAYSFRSIENTVIVSPSQWLLNESIKSKLLGKFQHKLIPNGIDTSVYTQNTKEFSKEKLGIDYNGRLLLFIATDIHLLRKGYNFVLELFPILTQLSIKILLVGNIGDNFPDNERVILLGKIEDPNIINLCYSASDALLFPTIADNLPNTMLESLCCGTPILGFHVGGLIDQVENGKNGYLSQNLHASGLEDIINQFYDKGISKNAQEIRKEALEKFGLAVQAESYKQVFTSISNKTF